MKDLDEKELETYKELYLKTIGIVLREERDHQHLEQQDISERSGLTRATISDLERAKNGRMSSLWQYCVLGLGLPFAVVCARAERRIEERRASLKLPLLPAYMVDN